MGLICGALCGMLLLSIKKYEFEGFNKNYMSPDICLPWKGFFICWIFLSHLIQGYTGQLNTIDRLFVSVNSFWMGQLVVVLFLFYSGYGVVYSITYKADNYLKKFPKNRIFKTWLHFSIIVLLYLLLQIVLGNKFTISTVLKAFIALDTLGNSNWYIFAILFLYLFSFIGFVITRRMSYRVTAGVIIVSFLTLAYIFVFRKVIGYSTVWYDSVLCYCIGMWYFIFENKIYAIVTRSKVTHAIILTTSVVFFFVNRVLFQIIGYNYMIYFTVQCLLLITIVLLVNMKWRVESKLLTWAGEKLFYIYMLQRIPFIILDHFGIDNLYVYTGIAAVSTVALVVIFSYYFQIVDRYFFINKNDEG